MYSSGTYRELTEDLRVYVHLTVRWSPWCVEHSFLHEICILLLILEDILEKPRVFCESLALNVAMLFKFSEYLFLIRELVYLVFMRWNTFRDILSLLITSCFSEI